QPRLPPYPLPPVLSSLFLFSHRRPPTPPLFPYTTLFRSLRRDADGGARPRGPRRVPRARPDRPDGPRGPASAGRVPRAQGRATPDRKSTRLNSSHVSISYAVFCLKKKTQNLPYDRR